MDFLPPMYMHQNLLASQKPKEVTSYDTIVIPFETKVWIATICTIIAQFLLLSVMQILWSFVSETNFPDDFIYEGDGKLIS